MTDRQNAQLSMARATLKALDAHADAWAGIPIMATYRDALDDHVAAIVDAGTRQARPTRAVTAVKDALRTTVRTGVWSLAAALQAWAADAERSDVAAQVDFTESDLSVLGDDDLAEESEIVVALAREHLADLAPYGVVAAEVDALDAADDEFADALDTPRAAIGARSRARSEIATEVAAVRTLLRKKLDPMVDRLSAGQPAFAQEYRSARVIVDRRGRGSAPPDADPAT